MFKIGAFCDCDKRVLSQYWNANKTLDFFKHLLYKEDMEKLEQYEAWCISDTNDLINNGYEISKKFKNILNKHLRFVKEYKSLLIQQEPYELDIQHLL